MKILILKQFSAHNGFRMVNFERMHVYNLPEQLAKSVISQGYACQFGFLNELPLTLPKQLIEVTA